MESLNEVNGQSKRLVNDNSANLCTCFGVAAMKFIDKALSHFIRLIEIAAMSIIYFVFNCFVVDVAYELMGLTGKRAMAAALTMFVLSTLVYGATFLNLITDNGDTK